MSTTTLLLSTFSPFPSLAVDIPSNTPTEDIPGILVSSYPHIPFHLSSLSLALPSGPLDLNQQPVSSLHDDIDSSDSIVTLRLAPRILGGKGGFGSQLRAAGGRMSSQKTSNNDSCRDLNGRRLSTVKDAKKMAEYIEAEPERKKAAAEAQRLKLETLERQLGISSSSPGAGSSSSSEPPKVAGTKHRFDDTAYLEQSRDIVDGVKSAVAAGLLRKRKKAKTDAAKSTGAVSTKTVPESKAKTAAETVVSAPATAAVVAGVSIAVGTVAGTA